MTLQEVYKKMQQYARIQNILLKDDGDKRVFLKKNDFTGQYGEYLVCEQLGLTRVDLKKNKKEQEDYDAIDSTGKKYQIKCRYNTNNTQISSSKINAKYDFLIFVKFNENYLVEIAYKIPYKKVILCADQKPKKIVEGVTKRIAYVFSEKKLQNMVSKGSITDITNQLNHGLP